MRLGRILEREWRPALGCTEPAAVAWAAAVAAAQLDGDPERVEVVCDPGLYKNCYAIGIPNSGGHSGIRWAAAIGAGLPEPELGLRCLARCDPAVVDAAGLLVERNDVAVRIDREVRGLWLDVVARRGRSSGRATVAGTHTALVRVERDGEPVSSAPREDPSTAPVAIALDDLDLPELLELAGSGGAADRERLREGIRLNDAICEHGIRGLPEPLAAGGGSDVARLVCGGVHARMSGEPFEVMTLSGSGNKGIVCAVPLARRAAEAGADDRTLEDALALACLLTALTTHHLGPLSPACGCANAAGIGLAAGLVALAGGGPEEVSAALTNMVGDITGLICDGAKVGCSLKGMTAVDAADRCAALALGGFVLDRHDGIVGSDGLDSLRHLRRIATRGLASMDEEILAILDEKQPAARS